MRHKIQSTKAQQFIDITHQVADEVKNCNVRDGIAVIYVPHTTVGVTINENADPDVVRDMLFALDKTYPVQGEYLHPEEIPTPISRHHSWALPAPCSFRTENCCWYLAGDLL